MQTETQKALYYELELIPNTASEAEHHSLWGWLARVWHSWIEALITTEPRVWSSTDQFGHVWWHVYCPEIGQTAHFSSPEKVRIWLDKNSYSA